MTEPQQSCWTRLKMAVWLNYVVLVLIALAIYDKMQGGSGAVGPTGVVSRGARRS